MKTICLYVLIVELDIIHKNLINFRGEIYASNYRYREMWKDRKLPR